MFVPLVLGLVVVAAALQLLLRVRRREFLDLVDKWPRVLCERWGKDYRAQSARAEEVLKSLGVRTGPDLSSVDAVLRSLPPETFYGTLALQIGLLAIDRLTRLVGRGFDFWWEYLPDRRECAFRVEAASRRLYPLTAVMTLWQQRDPEGLDPFVRTYGRDLQMRLAFAETLPALVALGFTAQGWDAFSKFAPRVEGELSGRGRVVAYPDASGGLRERVLGCGPVDLAIVEEPVEGEMTGRLVPTFAYPFAAQPGTTHLSLERSEDSDAPIAILPLGGQDNEIAARLTPSALKAAGIAPARIDCEICGVLDTARTLAHPEIEAPGARVPSSEPEESGEDETASPVNVLTARVLEVSEGVNPLNESRLLRIVLDLGSFRLPVLARTDLWQQAPRPGDVLQGTAWVFVRLPPPA